MQNSQKVSMLAIAAGLAVGSAAVEAGKQARPEHQTLQTAYAEHPVPKQVRLIVSGHMHRFQAIGFPASDGEQRPVQLVVGNGGVSLAHNHPEDPFSFPIDGMTGSGFGLSEFGYMQIELGDAGAWKGRLLGDNGATLAKCDSSLKYETGVCELASK